MLVGCAGRAAVAASTATLSLDAGWYVDEQIQLAEIYDTGHSENSEGASTEPAISPGNCFRHGTSLEVTESGSVASVDVEPLRRGTRVTGLPCPRLRPNPTLWDIRTPFMMDGQAEREARRLETAGGAAEEDTAARRRRRRRQHTAAAGGRGGEEAMVMQRLGQLLQQRRLVLEGAPPTNGCFSAGVGAAGDSAAGAIDTLAMPHSKCSELGAVGDSAGTESSDPAADGQQRSSQLFDCACDDGGRVCGGASAADYRLNNKPARQAARHVLDAGSPDPPFSGGNDTDCRQMATVQGRHVVLPPRCHFLCDDVRAACDDVSVAERLLAGGERFSCLVLDPPWTNKFVRRKRKRSEAEGYPCLDGDSLCRLPVRMLAAPGALVAVWCTNKPAHLATLRDVLFPAWGVSEITTWYWVKVTRHGAPVTSAGRHSKLPYERLLLGRTGPPAAAPPIPPAAASPIPPAAAPPIPPHRLLVSVPCALHSRKPPLNGLLRPYLPARHRGLEVFARSLLPGWTAWGDQVLMLQQPGTLLLSREHMELDALVLSRERPHTLSVSSRDMPRCEEPDSEA